MCFFKKKKDNNFCQSKQNWTDKYNKNINQQKKSQKDSESEDFYKDMERGLLDDDF